MPATLAGYCAKYDCRMKKNRNIILIGILATLVFAVVPLGGERLHVPRSGADWQAWWGFGTFLIACAAAVIAWVEYNSSERHAAEQHASEERKNLLDAIPPITLEAERTAPVQLISYNWQYDRDYEPIEYFLASDEYERPVFQVQNDGDFFHAMVRDTQLPKYAAVMYDVVFTVRNCGEAACQFRIGIDSYEMPASYDLVDRCHYFIGDSLQAVRPDSAETIYLAPQSATTITVRRIATMQYLTGELLEEDGWPTKDGAAAEERRAQLFPSLKLNLIVGSLRGYGFETYRFEERDEWTYSRRPESNDFMTHIWGARKNPEFTKRQIALKIDGSWETESIEPNAEWEHVETSLGIARVSDDEE